jgi:putative RNA 2'-phosphotransferase
MDAKRRKKVSKYLSKILRHDPHRIGLELDPGGWVNLETLLSTFREYGVEMAAEEIVEVIQKSDKPRFALEAIDKEESGDPVANPSLFRIRAAYGHSFSVDLERKPEAPPSVLYHGTAAQFVGSIQQEGLQSMGRQFVHLYEYPEGAWAVGRRKGRSRLFSVNAAAMYADGYAFYHVGEGIWLTRTVPPGYLQLQSI